MSSTPAEAITPGMEVWLDTVMTDWRGPAEVTHDYPEFDTINVRARNGGGMHGLVGNFPRTEVRMYQPVGHVFINEQDLNWVRVGTTIKVNPDRASDTNRGLRWRRISRETYIITQQGHFNDMPVGTEVPARQFLSPSLYAVAAIPTGDEDDELPGPRPLTPEQMDALPLGTVVTNVMGTGSTWIKLLPQVYASAAGTLLNVGSPTYHDEHWVAHDPAPTMWFSHGPRTTWFRLKRFNRVTLVSDLSATSSGFERIEVTHRLSDLQNVRARFVTESNNARFPGWLRPITKYMDRDPVPFEDLDYNEVYETMRTNNPWANPDPDSLRQMLKSLTTEPDKVDGLHFCQYCGKPSTDDLLEAGNGDHVCTRCYNNFAACRHCSQRFADITYTYEGYYVCGGCLETYSYSYCEECEEQFHPDSADEHTHGKCNCESPLQTFHVRNDGEGMLRNDTRVHISLPAGTISAEGMESIRQVIYRKARVANLEGNWDDYDKWLRISNQIEEKVGPVWQTRGGNFTKRLSRHAYKEAGLKVPPDLMSEIGNLARDHSTPVAHDIEITRDLNLPAGEFVHGGSCWWQSYSESRCLLKGNGGFGLRTFDDDGHPIGRAWVMPLKKSESGRLVPTFETVDPDGFIVFNGYGNLGGYAPARIMAHMTGWTYRKVEFHCPPMYVNNESGYLIAPEEIAGDYTDGAISISTEIHPNLFENEREDINYVA